MTLHLHGLAVAQGIAQGRAVVVQSRSSGVPRRQISDDQVPEELRRLGQARDALARELQGLLVTVPRDAPAELAAMIDVHLQLLQDEALQDAVAVWITEHHYNAEWALTTQMDLFARQFDAMSDAYLRERKGDLNQVVERLLHHLGGLPLAPVAPPASHDADPRILVAHDLSPADMLRYREGAFAGFVTDVGAATSHTAIVARSMGIPAVVAARGASELVQPDAWLILDGDAGVVLVDPPAEVRAQYRRRQLELARHDEELEYLAAVPACTSDGQAVQLLANIESPQDVPMALRSGAVGVGLFRTEFLFMGRGSDLPGEEEQYAAYRSVVEGMKGLPVTIRTIDVGADKPLDGARAGANPALGLRAIRWSLSDLPMFRTQLRALLRAAVFGPVGVLFPMVANLDEARRASTQVELARDELAARGMPAGAVRLGAMVEVPAAALLAEDFLQQFDFLSIGTNDLIQYTLAIDRSDETVAHLYDPLHPAVLRLIAMVLAAGERCGKEVSLCGEMAGDASLTRLLLGMGLHRFSMQPTSIPRVKQQILRSDAADLKAWAEQVVRSQTPRSIWNSRSPSTT